MILVSACLCGLYCRYDGKILPVRNRIKKLKNIIALCPEQLGGLPTPRLKNRIVASAGTVSCRQNMRFSSVDHDVLGGKARVINEKGKDVTVNFISGAEKIQGIVRLLNIKKAYLKEKSPSCGRYGVTTAKLKKLGVRIYNV